MQEIQVLDVGYYSLFPDIDTIGTERIGDYVVMLTSFGTDCISSYGCYPTYEVAAHQACWCMAEDAKDGLTGYTYEVWHLVDDSPECAEDSCDCEHSEWSDMVAWIHAMRTKYATCSVGDGSRSVSFFVPIHDKSLPIYDCEFNKWSDMLAWVGAMLPLIDMESYELKTIAV